MQQEAIMNYMIQYKSYIPYAVTQQCRLVASPDQSDWTRLNIVGRYLKKYPQSVLSANRWDHRMVRLGLRRLQDIKNVGQWVINNDVEIMLAIGAKSYCPVV